MNYSLRLCHFYPELLNLYGDFGNILALMSRAKLHNIDLSYNSLLLGSSLNLKDFDLFFIGGGQDSEQTSLIKDFLAKKDEIEEIVDLNKPLLAICGGYQLLAKRFITAENKIIEGLGVLAAETRAGNERLIGNTIYYADFLEYKSEEAGYIYGFENHSGRTYLSEGEKALARVIKGYGNNDEREFEGCMKKNVIATYSHGSLLPKNPALADYILERAIMAKYKVKITLPYVLTASEKMARDYFAGQRQEK